MFIPPFMGAAGLAPDSSMPAEQGQNPQAYSIWKVTAFIMTKHAYDWLNYALVRARLLVG